MFLNGKIFNLTSYLTVLLVFVAITGDYVVKATKLHLFQAVFDNATHALIGALSWAIVAIKLRQDSHGVMLAEIALCAILASLIDIDHFVAAKSLHLRDAANLKTRPPLHCSTFPIAGCLVVLCCSFFMHCDLGKKCALIVLTAFVSHHTRDATRRGYWFYPWGSTPAIPYFIYVAVTSGLPHFIYWLHVTVKVRDYTHVTKEVVI